MLLHGDEGYYAAEVAAQDEKFRVREMTEEELQSWDALAAEINARHTAADALRLKMRDENRLLNDSENARLHELGNEVMALQHKQIDALVCACVVWWSLDCECSVENLRRLPPVVKAVLADEIVKQSTLRFEEADFLAAQGKTSSTASR